jgi:hypothetical protein
MIPTIEDLIQMRDLTRMLGTLNNVQKKQLDMWSRVILGANDVTIEFDFENYVLSVDVSNLDYKTMMEGQQDPVEMYKRRMAKFDSAIKFLIGDEYSVVVKLKGKTLHRFAPKAPPQQLHLPKEEKK